jgi:hypothetical protein
MLGTDAGSCFGKRRERITHTSLKHVPYGQGSPATDLLGGHIDMIFDTVSPYLENLKAGKLRALAVTGEQRVSVLPDVLKAASPHMTPMPSTDCLRREAPPNRSSRKCKR